MARWSGPRRRGGDRDRDAVGVPDGAAAVSRGRSRIGRPSAVQPAGQDDGPLVQTTRGARTAAVCARCVAKRERETGARQHVGTVCAPARIAPRCVAKGERERGARQHIGTVCAPARMAWPGGHGKVPRRQRTCNPESAIARAKLAGCSATARDAQIGEVAAGSSGRDRAPAVLAPGTARGSWLSPHRHCGRRCVADVA